MTECSLYIDNEQRYKIEVKGHNNNSKICSCISVLVAALTGWCDNFDKEYSYRESDGFCSIEASKKAKDAVMCFYIGLKRLELMFPDLVKVKSNI